MKNGHSTFSALEYSRELKAVGVPEEQAELQARQFELMRHEIESRLSTKEDLEILEKNIEKSIETEIAKMGNALTVRVLMIVGFFVTTMGVLIKVL